MGKEARCLTLFACNASKTDGTSLLWCLTILDGIGS